MRDAVGPAGLSEFFAAWELFREPALTGLVAGGVLGFVGVYIVLRRMVFLSAALSQSAGLGVALAFHIQIHVAALAGIVTPTVGAVVLTFAAVGLVLTDHSRGTGRRDALLGLIFLAGSAGALAIGTRIVQEVQDIQTVLFGTAVAVMPEDFRLAVFVGVALLGLHLWWMRGFIQASFDPEGARVRGLPVRLLDVVLLLTLAVAISIFTRIIGALPVFAFTVLPAIAAVRLARNVPQALWLSLGVGAFTGFAGYIVAWRHDLPVGASQALLGVAIVLVAEVLRATLHMVAPRSHSNGQATIDKHTEAP